MGGGINRWLLQPWAFETGEGYSVIVEHPRPGAPGNVSVEHGKLHGGR